MRRATQATGRSTIDFLLCPRVLRCLVVQGREVMYLPLGGPCSGGFGESVVFTLFPTNK